MAVSRLLKRAMTLHGALTARGLPLLCFRAPLLIMNCLSAATPCAALSPASLHSCASPKRSAVRRSLQAMAVALGKKSNDADGRFGRALRGRFRINRGALY